MKIIYQGPHTEGVKIAATGQRALPGVTIVVDDELAARLLEQDVWAEPEPDPADVPVKKPGRHQPPVDDDPADDGQEVDQ